MVYCWRNKNDTETTRNSIPHPTKQVVGNSLKDDFGHFYKYISSSPNTFILHNLDTFCSIFTLIM